MIKQGMLYVLFLLHCCRSIVFNLNYKSTVMKLIFIAIISLMAGTAAAQTGGRIVDSSGSPLVSATITIKGKSISTTSDAEGRFTLPYKNGDVVVATHIGFQQFQQKITDAASPLLIRMVPGENLLDEVIVGSNVVFTKRKAEVSAITVIDAKAIAASPYQQVDQILRGAVPGTNSIDLGPGSNASVYVSIRGATAISGQGQIKVYIDGVQMAYNTNYLSTIDKSMIERIEISRGAGASTLYGTGASGGVIQIFTKKGKAQKPVLNLAAGGGPVASEYTKSNYQLQTSINSSGGNQTVSYYLGGQFRKVSPVVPDAYQQFLSYNGGAKVNLGKLSVDFTMQHSQSEMGDATVPLVMEFHEMNVGAPSVNTDRRQNRLDNLALGTTINYRAFDWWGHTLTIGSDRQWSRYWATVPSATNAYTYSSYDRTTPSVRYFTNMSLPVTGQFRTNITAGFDYAAPQEQYTVGDFSKPKGQGTFIASSTGLNDKNENYGYFLQVQPQLGEYLFLTAGVRVEKNDLFGSSFGWNGKAVSPRIGLTGNFSLGDAIFKPRISYGKGITAPTTLQRYGRVISSATVYLPNDDLAPTSQTGIDYGLEIFAFNNKVNFEFSYYDQKVRDLIVSEDLGTNGSGTREFRYINLQSVDNTGFEFAAGGKLAQFDLKGSFSIVNSKADELGPNYKGYLLKDKRLINVAHHLAGLSVERTFFRNQQKLASFNLSMNYMAGTRGYSYRDYYTARYVDKKTVTVGDFVMSYPAVTKFHLSGDVQLVKQLFLQVQIQNLFNNTRFESNDYYPVQGRSFLFGLSYTL